MAPVLVATALTADVTLAPALVPVAVVVSDQAPAVDAVLVPALAALAEDTVSAEVAATAAEAPVEDVALELADKNMNMADDE